MIFEIHFTDEARGDLRFLSKAAQVAVVDAIDKQLHDRPKSPTRHRKELDPNPISQWELRVGTYRIFYDINESTREVLIKAVGWKEHNCLFFRGKEFIL